MNKIKLSDSDKRLLIIFLAILMVVVSYFFFFTKSMSKASDIEDGNTKDKAQVQQMEACLKKAETEVKQAGAFTVQNWLEAELRAVNAPLYNRCKYKIRQTKPKKCR